MSLNKIRIYIETNTKIEYRKYTIYKATINLKTILLKNVFLKRSVSMAGIAGDLRVKGFTKNHREHPHCLTLGIIKKLADLILDKQ